MKALAPSCSGGTFSKRAVSSRRAGGGAPATVAETPRETPRPSLVHTAPSSAQSVVAGRRRVTAPVPPGVTVTRQAVVLPSAMGAAAVAEPPVTSSAARSDAASMATASLKRSSTVNGVAPSWPGGMFPSAAVSGALCRPLLCSTTESV